MLPEPLHPLRFQPILKELIWGGRRLGTLLGKPLGPGSNYAESWEISDHGDDVSRVADGPLAGASLRELIRDRGEETLGPGLGCCKQFPLLVKFIDAHQVLSVQVHPDDAAARRLANDNGKTESWVVLHAEPGSLIYAGLRQGVTRVDFASALDRGEVEPLLHRFEAKRGDCILIPAGTMHAIGAGVMLAEIQQMSDATFRVYDWGRVGPDGKPRQLHVAEALEVTNFDAGGTRERLARCEFFALERLRLKGPARVGSDQRFTIVMGLGGRVEIRNRGEAAPLRYGETLLLPAALGSCDVIPRGEAVVLTCEVP
jgi:mannose-6-phosphate isomerase